MTLSHKIPGRPWESVGTDIFTIDNRHFLCIVDYKSKIPSHKADQGFSAENLIKTYKIIFSEYGMPSKMVSEVGTNFISEKF